jgi:hypothetical protein
VLLIDITLIINFSQHVPYRHLTLATVVRSSSLNKSVMRSLHHSHLGFMAAITGADFVSKMKLVIVW